MPKLHTTPTSSNQAAWMLQTRSGPTLEPFGLCHLPSSCYDTVLSDIRKIMLLFLNAACRHTTRKKHRWGLTRSSHSLLWTAVFITLGLLILPEPSVFPAIFSGPRVFRSPPCSFTGFHSEQILYFSLVFIFEWTIPLKVCILISILPSDLFLESLFSSRYLSSLHLSRSHLDHREEGN